MTAILFGRVVVVTCRLLPFSHFASLAFRVERQAKVQDVGACVGHTAFWRLSWWRVGKRGTGARVEREVEREVERASRGKKARTPERVHVYSCTGVRGH